MKTSEEILARMQELDGSAADFFGFQRADLMDFLPYEHAKQFLKEEVTPEQWLEAGGGKVPSQEVVEGVMKDYMSFAWNKANNCRGLSAARSINHMQAWLWLLGDDAMLTKIDDYTHYGKPQLRAICEKYGVDWRALDDGEWRNAEDGPYVTADEVEKV